MLGHGLNFQNSEEISRIPNIIELNVGHFLISNSVIDGLEQTIKKFMKIINHSVFKFLCNKILK